MNYEWLSECCEAAPLGEVDETVHYNPIGFCSKCLEGCGFYEGAEMGEPFDTKEEKRGER